MSGRAFTCLYHGRTYNPEGELVAPPNNKGRPALDGDPRSLYPVAVRLWEGFIRSGKSARSAG